MHEELIGISIGFLVGIIYLFWMLFKSYDKIRRLKEVNRDLKQKLTDQEWEYKMDIATLRDAISSQKKQFKSSMKALINQNRKLKEEIVAKENSNKYFIESVKCMFSALDRAERKAKAGCVIGGICKSIFDNEDVKSIRAIVENYKD